eukprot:scaffold139037_cov32-Attheya_sp.AAC.1
MASHGWRGGGGHVVVPVYDFGRQHANLTKGKDIRPTHGVVSSTLMLLFALYTICYKGCHVLPGNGIDEMGSMAQDSVSLIICCGGECRIVTVTFAAQHVHGIFFGRTKVADGP